MSDVCVIMGMDWLSRFGALIDCEFHMVSIRGLSGGVLTKYRNGTRSELALSSAARVRQSLQQRCTGYVAYVTDMRVAMERPSSISDVLIVCKFPDVFSEELPGVPPESWWSSGSIWFWVWHLLLRHLIALCCSRCKSYPRSSKSCWGRVLLDQAAHAGERRSFLSRRRTFLSGCVLITGI